MSVRSIRAASEAVPALSWSSRPDGSAVAYIPGGMARVYHCDGGWAVGIGTDTTVWTSPRGRVSDDIRAALLEDARDMVAKREPGAYYHEMGCALIALLED